MGQVRTFYECHCCAEHGYFDESPVHTENDLRMVGDVPYCETCYGDVPLSELPPECLLADPDGEPGDVYNKLFNDLPPFVPDATRRLDLLRRIELAATVTHLSPTGYQNALNQVRELVRAELARSGLGAIDG